MKLTKIAKKRVVYIRMNPLKGRKNAANASSWKKLTSSVAMAQAKERRMLKRKVLELLMTHHLQQLEDEVVLLEQTRLSLH